MKKRDSSYVAFFELRIASSTIWLPIAHLGRDFAPSDRFSVYSVVISRVAVLIFAHFGSDIFFPDVPEYFGSDFYG